MVSKISQAVFWKVRRSSRVYVMVNPLRRSELSPRPPVAVAVAVVPPFTFILERGSHGPARRPHRRRAFLGLC